MTTYDEKQMAALFAAQAPVLLPSDWDDVLRRASVTRGVLLRVRRDAPLRRRRSVVVLAVAAVVVVVVTASALAVRTFIVDKGFVGLPPEGATPSAPATGELVLHFVGRSTTDERLTQVWVFADGRLIWARPGYLPGGANGFTTGLIEQHLTPAGVEQLRSEVLSTGLFDHDLDLSTKGFIWGEITARVDDHLVTVGWSNADLYSSDRDAADRTPATAEQYPALERLDALLPNPGLQLPASAWEDQAIRGYVPSYFSVCYEGLPEEVSDPQSDPSRILSLLPARAQAILDGKERTRKERQRGWGAGPYYPVRTDCSNVTTDEARELVSVLDASGLAQDGPEAGLAYSLDVPGPIPEIGSVTLEPVLPDGSTTGFRGG
jgi:hypothetical protein